MKKRWAVSLAAIAQLAVSEPKRFVKRLLAASSPALLLALLLFLSAAVVPREAGAGMAEDYNRAYELYQSGKLQDAAKLFEKIERQYRKQVGSKDVNYAQILNVLAAVYHGQGRHDEAAKGHTRALAIQEKVLGKSHPDVAVTIDALAGVYLDTGRYAEAQSLYERALAIEEKAVGKEHRLVATIVNSLANAHLNQGRYAEAERLYQRAVTIREKVLGPEHPDVGRTLGNLAVLYRIQGRYGEAISLFQRALAVVGKSPEPAGGDLVDILGGLANVYSDQGRFAEAEQLYRDAVAAEEKLLGTEHPKLAATLNNLAGLYHDTRRLADAERLYGRALAMREKAWQEGHPDINQARFNLALVYIDQGRLGEAEPLIERVLASEESSLGKDHASVAGTLDSLGLVHDLLGRHAEAEPLKKRALRIREKALGPMHPLVAASLHSLGQHYELQGRAGEAEPLYRRAHEIREQALGPKHEFTADSLIRLAGLLGARGDHAGALSRLRQAASIGHVSRAVHLPVLAAAWMSGAVPEAEAVAESFAVSQKASSGAASAALSQLAVRFSAGSDDLAELVREEQDLSARHGVLDRAILDEVSKPSAGRDKAREQSLNKDLTEVGKRLNELRAELASKFPDFAELSKPQVLKLADVQALLADGDALVLVDLAKAGDGSGYVWAVTSSSAAWRKLELPPGAVEEKVAALRGILDPDSNKAFDAKLAFDLYRLVFGAVDEFIRDKRHLTIVMNGALTSLPPQVLVTGDPAGKDLRSTEWLVRRHAITVLPSVSSLKFLRGGASPSPAPKPLTGYADPVFNPGGTGKSARSPLPDYGNFYRGLTADIRTLRDALPALPETADELRAVAKALGVPESEIVLGRAATETAVKSAKLADYRILYFATHGLVAGETEQFAKMMAEPALALSLPDAASGLDDGLLTASEVAQLRLNADWVVLSACNTAAGDRAGAEALSGLARAFFYAGARSMLVSHWSVESYSAVRLMTDVFKSYAAAPEQEPAAALQRAMLALMSDDAHPEYAHPAYWAPFVVVGEPRRATR